MSSILFRFLGLFLLVWLIQRVLGLILGISKNSQAKKKDAFSSSQMVKDPVCGMYMDSRLAIRLNQRSEEFYFCSEECKQKYLHGSSGEGAAESAASR
jgi:uncharacterized protein